MIYSKDLSIISSVGCRQYLLGFRRDSDLRRRRLRVFPESSPAPPVCDERPHTHLSVFQHFNMATENLLTPGSSTTEGSAAHAGSRAFKLHQMPQWKWGLLTSSAVTSSGHQLVVDSALRPPPKQKGPSAPFVLKLLFFLKGTFRNQDRTIFQISI